MSAMLLALLLNASLGIAAESALIEAVKKSDRVAVRTLLDTQSVDDVNIPSIDGTTALHWAVEQDDLETARLLVRAGADARAANRYGVTPLYAASVNGNAAIIELLLEAGADPNTSLPGGQTALMTAARTGLAEALTVLLRHGANANAKEERFGQTALMWAAAENHGAAVEQLLANGADINTRSNSGFTAFLFAVRAGRLPTARTLLDAGANVNDAIEPRRSSSTGSGPEPLNRSGLAKPTETWMQGVSALMLAILNGHYDLAAILLERGADVNNEIPGWTPLHLLVWSRRPNTSAPGAVVAAPVSLIGQLDSLGLAKALLAHGANVNARQKRELCIGGYVGAGVQRLVTPPDEPERAFYLPCTDVLGNRNNLNRIEATPFLLAAKAADAEMMRLLATNGADPLLRTTEQVTPLMAAAGVGIFNVGESPGTDEDALEAVKVALELGGDVNSVDANGDTALHGAALRGANAIVQLLADHGAKLDIKNSMGWTPLTIADGVPYTFTFKLAPKTAVLLRELMAKAAQ